MNAQLMPHPEVRKAVPFANRLHGKSSVAVFYGAHSCWDAARANLDAGRDAVALPPGERPEARNWNCVRGRSVVVVELDDSGSGFRALLVRTLAAWGAKEVVLIPHDHNPQSAVLWGVCDGANSDGR